MEQRGKIEVSDALCCESIEVTTLFADISIALAKHLLTTV